MTTLSQSELCDDIIIVEILTRLPVKSVVRFKSVSKKWYATLSSSDFATAHFNKSRFNRACAPVHTLFIASKPNYYYLYSYDDRNHIPADYEKYLVKLDDDFGALKNRFKFTGSCNGLICLTPFSHTYFGLWNPSTRKFHKYGSENFLDRFQKLCPDLDIDVACGFGYVSAVDDYKYVRIVSTRGCGSCDGSDVTIIDVFSRRRNKWRELDFDLSAYYIAFNSFKATLVNEKLYWAAQSKSDGSTSAIISFDLGAEEFSIFEYPSSVIEDLGIMGECLCKSAGYNVIDILRPPTIVRSITLPKDLELEYIYDIVGFTWDRKFFVSGDFRGEVQDAQSTESSALYLVNTDAESLECSKLMELEGQFRIERYVPSLISPFPIAEP